MSFSSIEFLVFFLVVLAVLGITQLPAIERRVPALKLRGARQSFLLCASYWFYAAWDWRVCFLMLLMTVVAYGTARLWEKGKHPRLCVAVGVVFPLCILGIFKYTNFFISSFCALFGLENAGTLQILLPVGISFYTFQSLSYTLDVSRGSIPASRSFVKLALYISFFPQLVAGPIVRASDFLPQLEEDKRVTWQGLNDGVQIFLFGLCKKIVLADHLSVFVDGVFDKPGVYNSGTVLLAAVAYMLQIYFDFSGYTDMAIGCARCMGYTLCRNFDLPYMSQSVTEFWDRWHISLSSWLQDYLFTPLAMSLSRRLAKLPREKRKKYKQLPGYAGLLITFLVSGLWHGAAWHFVFWGFMHGAALCVHKFFRKTGKPRKKPLPQRALCILATDAFVGLALIFFRCATFGEAMAVVRQLVSFRSGVWYPSSWTLLALAALIIATAVAVRHSNGGEVHGFYPVLDLRRFGPAVLFLFLVGLTLGLAYTGSNPFIYFQF